MTAALEMRCPTGPRRLLAKVRQQGGQPVYVDGSLIEFACNDCKRTRRVEGRPVPARVLHRFNVLGEMVETVEEWD